MRHAKNFIDMTGWLFGRLTVVSYSGRRENDGLAAWNCRCECGKTAVVVGKELRRGKSKSCGCLMIERGREANTQHGLCKTRVYRIWSGMWNRCTNINDKDYRRYGGRGIVVSERWRSFPLFLADMGQPPSDKHSIDRYPDPLGGYEPTNCRWATPIEQARNRRDNVLLTADGEARTAAAWSEISGVPRLLISKRVRNGWDVKKAIFTPPDKRFSRPQKRTAERRDG